jgi:hypothetical protein
LGYQGVEGPGPKRDGGEEIEVHTIGWRLVGLKGEAWEEGECEADTKYGLDVYPDCPLAQTYWPYSSQ